jgi:hypothetical protein
MVGAGGKIKDRFRPSTPDRVRFVSAAQPTFLVIARLDRAIQ